jgi:glycine betaine/proline transport system permease protein
LLVGLAGLAIEGWKLALGSMLLMWFVAATGYWEPAVVSIYLVSIAVIASLVIGMPIGYAISASPRARNIANVALDTLQTLPTLVYILPAVMFFRNGDFSAVLAILSYSIAPAIRYTMIGFANVPPERLEAAAMSGATPWQSFKWVRFDAAFPTLILGINQTVMMAFAMLVITALVGTQDLGQQVFIALSQAKVGEGILAGLTVAAIALSADGLLKAWARRIARENGMISEGE